MLLEMLDAEISMGNFEVLIIFSTPLLPAHNFFDSVINRSTMAHCCGTNKIGVILL